jgi:hypothetical protein
MAFTSTSWQNPVILILCFLIIVSIRFNRNSLVVDRPLNDAAFYIANVERHRGEKTSYTYKEPFNERFLVTILAAHLPLEPLTAINITNIGFLLFSLYLLGSILKKLGIPEKLVWLGLYLFVFSFSTFYYSTIGYTDPGVLAMIFMGVNALYFNKYWLFLLSMILGTFAKEGIVLLIPVALAYGYSRDDKKWLLTGTVAFIIFLGLTTLVKLNVGEHHNAPFFWRFDLNRVGFNLSRPNFYASSALSFGIPGSLCLIFLYKYGKNIMEMCKEDLPLIVGTISAFLPWIYMIFSAFPDGRAFWIASCFPIALSMVWWNRYGNPFTKTPVR